MTATISKIEESLFQLINATIPAFERRIDELEHRTENSISALRKEFKDKLALSDAKITRIEELENRTHESVISIRKEVTEKFTLLRDLNLNGPMDWLKAKVNEYKSIPVRLKNHGDFFSYPSLLSCFRNGALDLTSVQGYENVVSIVIPPNVTVICKNCFRGCDSLREVIFYEGSQLKQIGALAFYMIHHLPQICIPASVEEIGEGAFASPRDWDSSWSGINIKVTFCEGSQLRSIGYRAFKRAFLTEICIPVSVEEIAESAFEECRLLGEVTFCEGSRLKKIGKRAFFNTGLKEVCIPTSVEEIAERGFSGCNHLDKVTFCKGSRLRNIGYRAFCSAKLTEIRIPARVEEIASEAFANCNSLRKVTFRKKSRLRNIGDNAFSQDYSNERPGCLYRNFVYAPTSIHNVIRSCGSFDSSVTIKTL